MQRSGDLNTRFASAHPEAGYPWTVVPVQRRDDYMTALEAASADHDIVPFARFLADLTRGNL